MKTECDGSLETMTARWAAEAGSVRRRVGDLLLRRLRLEDSGQAAVELGVTLPFLLLVLTGMTSFAFAANNYISLAEAIGTGGRKLAVSRAQGGDPCALAAAAVAAAAPRLKNTGSSATGIYYTITINSVKYASATPTCASATMTQGQAASVQATYPCNLNIFHYSYSSSCLIGTSTTEVIQ